jgi:hypothetical protein
LDFFLAETVSSLRALRFVFKDQKWIKSSLEAILEFIEVRAAERKRRKGYRQLNHASVLQFCTCCIIR